MLIFSIGANATTYYFSFSEGDDSRTTAQAQSPATPWKSLDKLNAVFSSLAPGDVILFKRGDVFTGTIYATASGTLSAPISLGAYGTGAKPVISGLSSISGWTLLGDHTWEAAVPSGNNAVNILLLNDAMQRVGRYPNATAPNGGYLTIKSFSTNTSIVGNDLASSPSWEDGEVVIRKNRWVLDRNKITRHDGNTIYYTSQSGYNPSVSYGYFIQNHSKTLDLHGEWYYNSSRKRLGIYSTSGAPSTVQASTISTLARVHNQNNIRFKDLVFKGANGNAIEIDNAYGVGLLNCDILYSGANAVLVSSSNNLQVEGCNILYTNNTALELRYSSNAVIKNNKIKSTGIFAGMGNGDSGSYEGILMDGDNELIEGNEIDSTGYIPITFRGNVNIIRNNFINTYNFVKDDGGGIYTWNNLAGAASTYGSKITDNILLNGEGAGEGTDDPGYLAANGIYMDDNTAGVEIKGNTVANCGLYGLYIHNGHELSITDNTFYNSRSQAVLAHDSYADYAPIRNVSMFNNVFFSKDNSQLLAEFKTPKNDIANFGTFDNNYYCRPTYDSYVINVSYQSDGTNLDLAEWKALYGKDAVSLKSPITATSYNHIRFEYNASATSTTVSLDGTYIDARNTTYNGSITLAPFSSAVLIKKVQPTSLCPGTGSITREQWNNTLNGDLTIVPWQTTPSKISLVTGALETATLGDAYGSRISGYLCPPQTGTYTFWIAGDDRAELWLSTSDNPGAKRKIASLDSWTVFRDWNKTASQKSASIYLEGGKKYYIEALQKEGNGGDHLSVAWQLPDGTMEAPIQGTRLSPNANITIGLLPQTITFPPLANVSFGTGAITLLATASSGLPVSFSVVSGPAAIAGNLLTLTAPGTITIRATQDGNDQYDPAPEVIQSFTVSAEPQCAASGSIGREQWDGINGNDIWQIPLTTAPSSTSLLTVFEGPRDLANQYGSRIRGYICPPQTGAYTFFIAGDDATELWLSTDEAPASKTRIAYSLSWTGWRDWTRYSTQQSASINLEAGKKYYIEALQKEGGGGDHLSVGWQMPGGVFERPIAGSRLSPYIVTATAQNQTITFSTFSNISLGSAPVTLEATASSGLPVTFSLVSGPATLAGNLLTPTGAGTVVIKASQSGNAFYTAAPDVTRNVTITAPALCSATGSILREQWNAIDGNDVAQIPLDQTPSSISQLSFFEGPINLQDHYGSRIRGYLCPPQTGTYTFWIAGDDATELWLSTTDAPSDKVKIAYSLSWTHYRDWHSYPTQKSVAVYLQAGIKYYIEALQKEGSGGDHLSVAWQMPDGVMEAPIAGSRLLPYANVGNNENYTKINAKTAAMPEEAGQYLTVNQPVINAFPNPFTHQTTVEITSAASCFISVDVYDVSGRLISGLFNGIMHKGTSKRFYLQGRNLSSGIYFIRISSADGVIHYKVVKR
ncbi:MAG TPA: PA14 domain-containing protein [Flavisolibacter sp.]|nr:PA14 domain-containing protein [Flavisolibacter sp.]